MRIKTGAQRIPREKDSVDITFCYRESLLALEKGDRLFQILRTNDLLPNKYQVGLKRESFENDQLDALIRKMWLPVVWYNPDKGRDVTTLHTVYVYKSKRPKYWGSISREAGERARMLSDVDCCIEARGLEKADGAKRIESLFSELLMYGKADFARIQYYTAEENGSGLRGGEPDTTLVSHTLVYDCIPDLYNITVWGEPYIKFFGREKLLSAPCHKVEELPRGLIWMQLSPHVYTNDGCWVAIREVREKAKRHLNQKAFYDRELYQRDLAEMTASWDEAARLRWHTGEGKREYYRRTYNVPEFDLSEIRKPLTVPEVVKR